MRVGASWRRFQRTWIQRRYAGRRIFHYGHWKLSRSYKSSMRILSMYVCLSLRKRKTTHRSFPKHIEFIADRSRRENYSFRRHRIDNVQQRQNHNLRIQQSVRYEQLESNHQQDFTGSSSSNKLAKLAFFTGVSTTKSSSSKVNLFN